MSSSELLEKSSTTQTTCATDPVEEDATGEELKADTPFRTRAFSMRLEDVSLDKLQGKALVKLQTQEQKWSGFLIRSTVQTCLEILEAEKQSQSTSEAPTTSESKAALKRAYEAIEQRFQEVLHPFSGQV